MKIVARLDGNQFASLKQLFLDHIEMSGTKIMNHGAFISALCLQLGRSDVFVDIPSMYTCAAAAL